MEDKILKWAIELQSLAQAGLYYGKDIYDIERIAGKIIYGTENGKDLLSLKDSIRKSLETYKLLKEHQELKKIFELDIEILLDI